MDRNFLAAIAALGGGRNALELVLARVDFGVFVDHPEKGCVYANDEVLRMFEMDWQTFRGFGWAKAVVHEDMETLREAIERYEREKSRIEVQYRIEVPDGSRRAIHVFGQAVLDEAGKHVGSVMLGREVTAERAVTERATQLQKLEAIGTLAGRVAHDFNNVLTPIMFSASTLAGESLTRVGRTSVETIIAGAEHAAAMTRQLLSLSRQRVEEKNMTNLDAEIDDKRTFLQQLAGERVELQLALSARDVEIPVAPHELTQILLNLIVNARDASSGAGTVLVETARRGTYVDVRVTDRGSGMSPEIQERIFEPFFSTKDADRGTGLGLYTVRELVGRAGGRIAVDSRPGHGTTMTLTFPCVAASPDEARDARATESVPPCRVLIVDDNAALRQTLAYVLALRGHDVKASADLGRSLELLATERFDLIVTDVLLADGSGADLVREARARQPDLGVIYMSGFAGDALETLGLDEPRTLFLSKPFHPNRLSSALAEVLR